MTLTVRPDFPKVMGFQRHDTPHRTYSPL
jgi:hypothetical protein